MISGEDLAVYTSGARGAVDALGTESETRAAGGRDLGAAPAAIEIRPGTAALTPLALGVLLASASGPNKQAWLAGRGAWDACRLYVAIHVLKGYLVSAFGTVVVFDGRARV